MQDRPKEPVKKIKDFSLFGSDNHCRYIYGDYKAKDKAFCGEAAKEGSAYCVDHHSICYVKKRKPKND